jgi:hypothetical protein
MSNGQVVVDGDGNIDAPVTTTDLTVSNDLTVGNDVEITGDVSIAGSLSVDGATISENVISDTITLATDKKLQFRDTGLFIHSNADGKITLSSDGVGADDITITGSVTHTGDLQQTGAVVVGVNDTGHDVTFFGATTGKKMVWDESADQLVMDGNITMVAGQKINSSVSNTFYPVTLDQPQQAINANGAITLTQYNTAITSVGTTGQAFTLADSTVIGQIKRMQMIVDDGDATVTFNTNATIVFADVGDVAEVIWNGSDWLPIALYNCADGATAPSYTPAS